MSRWCRSKWASKSFSPFILLRKEHSFHCTNKFYDPTNFLFLFSFSCKLVIRISSNHFPFPFLETPLFFSHNYIFIDRNILLYLQLEISNHHLTCLEISSLNRVSIPLSFLLIIFSRSTNRNILLYLSNQF